jgi:guanylate kinase
VSHTTRQPRKGEENGTHYHFAAKDDMETAIANNEFLEYAKVHLPHHIHMHRHSSYLINIFGGMGLMSKVHTNYYGTSLKSVKRVQESKRIPILEG